MIKQSILLANLLLAVGIAEGHGLSSTVNIGISSPTLHLNNSGDISVKGTSEVTVTDGVPEDKVNFSIEGNGVLSATSATFNNEGKASVTVTGQHPYSGIINVKALTDYGKKANTSLGISSPDIIASNNGAISVKGSSVVTIKNGVAGDKVTFSSNGDGTLSATSATFDNNGNASVTVTGKHPYSNAINVKATTDYNKEASTSVAISAPAISVSNSGGISGKGNSTITVSNGVAGDKVYFSNSGNGYLSASSATFNSSGNASVTVTGKNPYSGTIGVTATTDYGKSASTSLGISAPNISVSNSGAINGTGSNVVTVSGGVPGESVGWSYSSTYMTGSCDSAFNSSGVARCTFYGRGNIPSGSVTTETTKTLISSDTYSGTWSSSGGISGGNGTWNYNGYTLKNANNSFSITNVTYSSQGCTVTPKVEVISQTTSNVSFKLGGTVSCNAGGTSGGGGNISFKVSTTATVVETSGSGTGSVNESVSISTNYGKTGSTSFLITK